MYSYYQIIRIINLSVTPIICNSGLGFSYLNYLMWQNILNKLCDLYALLYYQRWLHLYDMFDSSYILRKKKIADVPLPAGLHSRRALSSPCRLASLPACSLPRSSLMVLLDVLYITSSPPWPLRCPWLSCSSAGWCKAQLRRGSSLVGWRSGATPVPSECCLSYNLPLWAPSSPALLQLLYGT